MSDERVLAHVLVSGRVQGVFFRASTRETATAHGVAGWVRNLDDGRVEAVFEGPDGAVEAVIEWCHEGPPRSRVNDVVVEYRDPAGWTEFSIRR